MHLHTVLWGVRGALKSKVPSNIPRASPCLPERWSVWRESERLSSSKSQYYTEYTATGHAATYWYSASGYTYQAQCRQGVIC